MTLKRLLENILFASNIFVLFLLIFLDSVFVPHWLQPVGRMHPLLLHFPIVLILLAMLLEFFRYNTSWAKEKTMQRFNTALLLGAALCTSLTVIMGLLLSKEEGYTGETLIWHKWTGAALVFAVSLVYWIRNLRWYKAPIAKINAVGIICCLLATGHYGATLTHGDQFIWAPLMKEESVKVPLTEAIVWNDVILPVFTQKCINCHNPDKAKGDLILTNVQSLLKGGKTGKLFESGKPEVSLLLKRIHLPVEDEKHMPPKGKPQLTTDEIALLKFWIKESTDLNAKVISLKQDDSLRILSTKLLSTPNKNTDSYDFKAADKANIDQLNNNYRLVYPLARDLPALGVNMYNRDTYNKEALQELLAIKEQLVSLNLNNLPIKDDHLKLIQEFTNLRNLYLNFTDITGDGLQAIASLKYLNNLSLSGSKVQYAAIKQFLAAANVKQLSLWNTPITAHELAELQNAHKDIIINTGFKDDGKNPVKLTLPRLIGEESVFTASKSIAIKHPINNVQLRYTTDGSEPDSLRSPVYKDSITIRENTLLKVKAFKDGWFGSDILTANFYRSSYQPDSILLLLPPDPFHQGEGAKTLIDHLLGDDNTNTDKWLGFRENELQALLRFKEMSPIQSVTLSMLQQVAADILPPQLIEIWGGTDADQLRLLTSYRFPRGNEKNGSIPIEITFHASPIRYLKIVAKNAEKKSTWLFIDEILLN